MASLRFPLGNLVKPEVRALARAFGLPVADKAESQEICFVSKGSYAEFVAKRRPDVPAPGEIVDAAGSVIGRHKGLVHHTIGQRKGIGLARAAPLYVLSLDPVRNRLMVGSRAEATARAATVRCVTMIDGTWPSEPFACDAVVRYRATPAPAMATLGAAGQATVRFTGEGPVASPGQAAVFYRGDEVLGGGTIQHVRGAVDASEPASASFVR